MVDMLRLIYPTHYGGCNTLESGKAEALPYVQFILRPKGMLVINKEVNYGT